MNTPYEKDSNIVPSLAMTGILSTAAYGSYKVITQEGYLNNKYNSFMDTFFPEQEIKGSYLKSRITNISKSLSSAFEYAEARQKATYADRYNASVEKLNKIKTAGGESIDLKWESKTKEIFTDVSQIQNIHGEDIGSDILKRVESLYNKKSTGVEFSGTFMNIKFGDEVVSVPTAMRHAKTNAWTVMTGEGTLYTAPWVQELEGSAGQITKSHISDWNQHILDTLGDQRRALLTANVDNKTVARNVMEYVEKYKENPDSKAAEKIINTLKMKVDADKAVLDFDSIHSMRRLFKNIQSSLFHNEIHDLAGIEKDSRVVKMGNWGLWNLHSKGDLPGAFGSEISLNKMAYFGDQPANAVEGSTLDALATANQVTRRNGFATISGKSPNDISDEVRATYNFMSSNIAYVGSQGQVSELTSSVSGAMTRNRGVDALKSIKGYRFSKSGRMPLIWDPIVEANNPYTYDLVKNKGSMRMLTVYDTGTEELFELRSGIANNLRATRAFEVKVDKGYSWKGLRTEEELKKARDLNLFPKYRINGEWKQDKTMFEIYEDKELLKKIDRIEADKTIFGTRNVGTQLKSLDEYSDLENRTTQAVSYDQKLIQTRKEINATAEYLDKRIGGPYKFLMQAEEPITKVGDYHTMRSVLQILTDRREKNISERLAKEGVDINWQSVASFDFLEKVFATQKGTDVIGGKQIGELLTNIQELAIGHAASINGVILEGDIAKGFKKYLVNPEKFNGNLTKSINKIQINQNAGEMKEQLDIFTRMLGAMRGHQDWTKPLVINDSMTYDKASSIITEQLRNTSQGLGGHSWIADKTLFPHESLYTQGFGSNIFRMNVSDNLFMMPGDVLSAITKDSLLPSRKIANEYRMYMDFGNKDMASELEKYGAPILDENGISEMLGKDFVNLKDLEDPYFRLNSFLNPEKNPKGFGVKTYNGNVRFFGSNLYNDIQYLTDEEKEVLSRIQRTEARILLNARDNGGVISEEYDKLLMNSRIELGTSVKEGPVRRMGLLIEGAQLDKAYYETTLLNNKEAWKQILASKHEELQGLLGFATVTDRGTMERSLLNELQGIQIMSKDKNISLLDAAREKFGEGSIFESHITGVSEINAREISRKIADESVKDYQKLTDLVFSKKYDEAANLIKTKGHTLMGARAPYVYSSSKFLSFGFATDEGVMDGGKFVAYGQKARTTMNLDHDGDISTIKFFYEKSTRDSVYNRILKEQTHSYELLTNLKNNRKSMFESIYGKSEKLYMPGSDKIDDLVGAMMANERESALTAMITKYTAGSAHVRTKEMTSALLNRIYHDQGLSESEAMKAMITAIDMPTLNIVQGSLSGKHVEKVLGGARKIDYLVNNIGKFTKEKALETIVNLQGDIGALTVQNILGGTLRMYGQDAVPWLRKDAPGSIYNALETHTDLATMWRRPTETRFREAYEALGWNQDKINTAWSNFQKSVEDNKTVFTNELPEFRRYRDMSYIEAMKDISKDPSFFGSEKSEALMSLAKRKAGTNGDIEAAMGNVLQDNPYFGMGSGQNILGDAASSMSRRFKYADQIEEVASKIKPRHIAGALGLGLVAITAMNLLGGDGTPEDINDLPSVSNPSFGGYHRGSISSPRTVSSFMGNNTSMGLLTDRRISHQDTVQSISALFSGKVNNTVSVRSDGTDPYKSDMYTYRG